MKSLKKIFKNWNPLTFYACSLVVIDATPFSENQNQLRSLHINIKNCLFLYANNKRIPKNSLIQISALDNKTSIEVKAIGIFQTKIVNVPVGKLRIATRIRKFNRCQSLIVQQHKDQYKSLQNKGFLKPIINPKKIIRKNIEISSNKNNIAGKTKNYQLKTICATLKSVTNQ
ncbi:hypothetical protein [Cellulophaga tyrosinoxydans]|uniref:hypothetical protein n=1 Tax=Cellulophaga tyrosinoxydans TaxID=504486 RepID=UPI0009FCFD78|nr:hypothetical protein [Cellulophaga tyrosinoxydans]